MDIVTVWIAGLCISQILLAIQVIRQDADIKRRAREIVRLENQIRRLAKT